MNGPVSFFRSAHSAARSTILDNTQALCPKDWDGRPRLGSCGSTTNCAIMLRFDATCRDRDGRSTGVTWQRHRRLGLSAWRSTRDRSARSLSERLRYQSLLPPPSMQVEHDCGHAIGFVLHGAATWGIVRDADHASRVSSASHLIYPQSHARPVCRRSWCLLPAQGLSPVPAATEMDCAGWRPETIALPCG